MKKLALNSSIFCVSIMTESYLRLRCTKIFDRSIVMHAVKVSCQEVLKPSIPRIHFTQNLVTFLQQCKMKPFIKRSLYLHIISSFACPFCMLN